MWVQVTTYVLKQAENLGLDSRNIAVRTSPDPQEASVLTWNADGLPLARVELGENVQKNLLRYIKYGENNSAPLTIEHELQHVVQRYSESVALFDQTAVLGGFLATAAFARKAFALSAQDSLKKSLVKSGKIGSVALVATIAQFLAAKTFSRYLEKRADLGAIKNIANIPLIEAYKIDLENNARKQVKDFLLKNNRPVTQAMIDRLLSLQDNFLYLELDHPSMHARSRYIEQAVKDLESTQK